MTVRVRQSDRRPSSECLVAGGQFFAGRGGRSVLGGRVSIGGRAAARGPRGRLLLYFLKEEGGGDGREREEGGEPLLIQSSHLA